MQSRIIFLFALLIPMLSFGQRLRTKVTIKDTIKMDRRGYAQMFGDEFDGTSLDTSKWYTYYPYGPATKRDSCSFCRTHVLANVFKDENCVVNNGTLSLVTKQDSTTWFDKCYGFSSAIVYSKPVFTDYSRYEIRCKIPEGNRQWPAFWVFGWNTEIDIFEFICKGTRDIEFSVHNWQTTTCKNRRSRKGQPCYSSQSGIMDLDTDFADGYHTYAVEYDEYLIKFFVDDVMVRYVAKYYDMDRKPVTRGIINPGTYYLNDAFPPKGEPVSVIANQGVCWNLKKSTSTYPNQMDIDYIKVSQRNGLRAIKKG